MSGRSDARPAASSPGAAASDRSATLDGNAAVADVAHRLSEVVAIYPITPASPMGELADEWSVAQRPNLWGQVPQVVEMQSEAGAAGAVHGALQAGSLTTTFTASQGLLLMLPNMFKIAGELTPFCMHVAARSLATHALSIFCDHSDVMAARSTGFALLSSASVQEAHDMAAIAHAATLRSRVPFLHFFDGFRTSHEVAKVRLVGDEALGALVDEDALAHVRARALTPEAPTVRGTAQNPDVFFQAREAANRFHEACPAVVEQVMERFGALTGRHYRPFEYVGHPQAERVVVLMGSAAETAEEAVEWLTGRDERVGVVKVRLYRPFDVDRFLAVLPPSVSRLAVLDRTKEPGAHGEPLYLDVVAALHQAAQSGRAGAHADPAAVQVVGGRYGLGSKELTPAMVQGVLDALGQERPPHGFTVGIVDDVTHRSLPYDTDLDVEPAHVKRAVFYGLGSDGTVGATKQTLGILGDHTEHHVQGYFVYDSKKAGAVTVSHVRFGPRPIRSAYLVNRADYVACHAPHLLDTLDVLELAADGATFLLNSPHPPDQVWDSLPRETQATIVARNLRLFAIDAHAVAADAGLGRRIGPVLQTCFFALSGVLPRDEALSHIREAVSRAHQKRGPEVVRRNLEAIDTTLAHLHEVPVPAEVSTARTRPPTVPSHAPDFVQRVTSVLLAGKGDLLPVSAFPVDGTWPVGTAQFEKRHLALEVPEWDPQICIQCNKCAEICPHSVIRPKVVPTGALADAPEDMPHVPWRGREVKADQGTDLAYVLQVAPDDCTGCGLCVAFCPAKDKHNPRHKAIDMVPAEPVRARERARWDYFTQLPSVERARVHLDVKGTQLLEPLFEFSGACAGCGETPYLKLLSQLFGDRALIANATGCSSIYGGNLPTTPWRTDAQGRGPAWANSLFEDNAEFGLGFRMAVDAHRTRARQLVRALAPQLGDTLCQALSSQGPAVDEAELAEQRARITALQNALRHVDDPRARELAACADALVDRSVWIVGGDGWAYDIGFGGLDHVLALGADVNVLVLDTEVYSNTGGQQSKATPLGAAAKFASAGKGVGKKDLGLLAMSYGHVYVASVAMGARDAHTLRAFREAQSFRGPSLIIAYSHCIAHGYDLVRGADQQRLAVESGVWPLYRFDPRRIEEGKPPLQLDAPAPKRDVSEYMANEGRFRMVQLRDPKRYEALMEAAREQAARRRALYQQLATIHLPEELLHDEKGGVS